MRKEEDILCQCELMYLWDFLHKNTAREKDLEERIWIQGDSFTRILIKET